MTYQIPKFNRPIMSPDFKKYIERPIRKRFIDSEIWPIETAIHRGKIRKNKIYNKYQYKSKEKYQWPSYYHREKIIPFESLIN